MVTLHPLASFKVGDGACHLQDTAIGTGRETEPFHRHSKHIETRRIGFGKQMDHPLRHLGITVDTLAGVKKLDLNLKDGKVDTVRVDMGAPILTPEKIPVDP